MKSWMKTVFPIVLFGVLATGCGLSLFPPSERQLAEWGFDGFDNACRSLLPEDPEGYEACREEGCKEYPDAPQCDADPGT